MPALDGMRILDMTQYEAGTSCTQALAWLGADVVKVERPGGGDPGRSTQGQGNSPYFLQWNSNKRSMALDLSQPQGRDLLLAMAPHYDVFVENYGPGVVDRLDIDYDVMRQASPSIIYARLKGFGTTGPYAHYKCFDKVAQAVAGVYSATGELDGPPVRPGNTVGDSGTGMQLALAILAAYIQRQRTGEGQLIEIAMQEAMTYYMRTTISGAVRDLLAEDGDAAWGAAVAPRGGDGPSPLNRLYPCTPGGSNDYVQIICNTGRMWDAMCLAMGAGELAADPRFAYGRASADDRPALYEAIASWTKQHTKWEVMRILGEAGVPAGAVFDTSDLFTNEHLVERGFVHTLDHPEHGEIQLLGWGPRMSASDVPMQRAPLLGEHSDEVLAADLALDGAALEALREQGVLG